MTLQKLEQTRPENAPPIAAVNYFVKYANHNYYIVLNQFKTSKKYPQLRFEIKQEFSKMLRRYLRMIHGQPYLFTNPATGVGYTTGEFTKWIQSMFAGTNKSISSTLLRHVVVSERFGEYMKQSAETARIMGHSQSMQQLYVKY